jgi:hypothetical protein
MKAKSTILLLYFVWLIAAVMLVFAAAAKQPDSFYTMLRWVCCAVFAYSAVTSFQMKRMLRLGFSPCWGLCLIQSSRSLWIADYGSWRIGFQSARWLLPPLSFGKIQKSDQL